MLGLILCRVFTCTGSLDANVQTNVHFTLHSSTCHQTLAYLMQTLQLVFVASFQEIGHVPYTHFILWFYVQQIVANSLLLNRFDLDYRLKCFSEYVDHTSDMP